MAARDNHRTLATERRQVNIRIDAALYGVLQRLARQDSRSVPQMTQRLIEDGLRQRAGGQGAGDDVPSAQVAGAGRLRRGLQLARRRARSV